MWVFLQSPPLRSHSDLVALSSRSVTFRSLQLARSRRHVRAGPAASLVAADVRSTSAGGAAANSEKGGESTPVNKERRGSSRFDRMRAKFGLDDTVRGAEPAYAELDRAVQDLDYKYELNMIIPGKVVHFEPRGALVDVGAKTAAFLPLSEMAMERISSPEEVLKIGEEREFQIIATEDTEGQLRVSIKRIEYTRAWEQMQRALAEDAIVQSEVVAVNRGGASIKIGCLRGFLPASHIVLMPNFIPGLPSDPRLEGLDRERAFGEVVGS
ncbi:ribosomal protein S1 [Cyanidiococcus yangmingshanensis]|uniref:Ribosomal protein S1 n=1 Tax=Cyanidiococcus yangmingshanensis TaxID=2690220 RepID=A0A7J7IIG7_9RHOD|nr:ribosomal protein S1 [Cyanidiococcus yangmingshanensis]